MPDFSRRDRVRLPTGLRDGKPQDWYRIRNATGGSDKAEVHIYDEIGFWGVTAKDFVDAVKAIDAKQIDLHINSPGGDVFDAIAILNTLRQHPARITAIVDGVAASAASFIAMAGDEVVMSPNAEMMIHDAAGLCVGNANDMADLAGRLDQISDNIASIYADRAGGTITQWRDAMRAETWYSAPEAVEAGLADRLAVKPPPDDVVSARARFDLSVFNFAGRAKAPTPAMPRASAPVDVPPASPAAVPAPEKGAGMDPAKIREALGLSADASDDDVRGALRTSPFVDKAPEADVDVDGPSDGPPKTKPTAKAAGTMVVDVSAWEDREERLRRLEAAAAKASRDERDTIIDHAVRDGKFAPSRKPHWVRLWDVDPDGTREVIASLAKNVVPVAELGGAQELDDDEFDREFSHLFPPTSRS